MSKGWQPSLKLQWYISTTPYYKPAYHRKFGYSRQAESVLTTIDHFVHSGIEPVEPSREECIILREGPVDWIVKQVVVGIYAGIADNRLDDELCQGSRTSGRIESRLRLTCGLWSDNLQSKLSKRNIVAPNRINAYDTVEPLKDISTIMSISEARTTYMGYTNEAAPIV